VSGKRATLKLKQQWTKGMVEMLSKPPINDTAVRRVLRILGAEDHRQEVLDV